MSLVLALVLALVLGAPGGAGAADLMTSIDLGYVYDQRNLAGAVTGSNSVTQKYQLGYTAPITSEYDLVSTLRLELENTSASRRADTSRVSPSLELAASGGLASYRMSYQSVVSKSGQFEETGEIKTYSNSFTTEFLVTPDVWPEVNLKLQRKMDYQQEAREAPTRNLELTVKKGLDELKLEFSLKREHAEIILPSAETNETTEWDVKASWSTILWGGPSFETTYEIKQNYAQHWLHGAWSNESESYAHQLRLRFLETLELTPRLKGAATYDFQVDQNLYDVGYYYKTTNKLGVDFRYEFSEWARTEVELTREYDNAKNRSPDEDEGKVLDTFKGRLELDPYTWLRIASRAEIQDERRVGQKTGASVDDTLKETYETVAKNKIGEWWDLMLTESTTIEHKDGWLTSKEGKLKADLRLRFSADLSAGPAFESSRTTSFQEGQDFFDQQKRDQDIKLRVEWRRQFLGVLTTSVSYEYGMKNEQSADAVLNYDETKQMSEDLRLTVSISDLLPDLRVEGEVSRKATDTLDDSDPMLINVSYSLKMDWSVREITLSASFKYDDKGDTFDNMSANGKIGWRSGIFDVSGEYQFDKVFADETDETRRLSLKLGMRF